MIILSCILETEGGKNEQNDAIMLDGNCAVCE